jgi:circadian clock protein KaiB
MAIHASQNGKAAQPNYLLRLFISGVTARSQRALANLKQICDEHLEGQYTIEVTDIFQNPEKIAAADIVAAPTLIKQLPLPVRRFVGDLSNREKVLQGLAIQKTT